MNIWDSVHRGLEKASQEAARIAKTQRLRFTIDTLSRQINTHNSTLVSKVMEMFTAGQLTQSELFPLCQELVNLQQQVEQAQNELRLLQTQGQQPTPTNPYTGTSEVPPTMYAPPPPPSYQHYEHNTIPAPPPPPGHETVSALETVMIDTNTSPPASSAKEQLLCPNCQAKLTPGNAFCHNCGTFVQNSANPHLPTMRANTLEAFPQANQETTHDAFPSSTPNQPIEQEGGN